MADRAKVIEIRASGVVVQLPDGRQAWLPARELYPLIKPHEDFRGRARPLLRTEIEVVVFQEGLAPDRPLVSHVRATNDPWNEVATWEDGEVKVMEVIASTRGGAIGIIPPGIRASMQLPGGRSMLPPSWNDFDFPLPGDEVAGYFRRQRVNDGARIVALDFEAYARSRVSLGDALVAESRHERPVAAEAVRPLHQVEINGAARFDTGLRAGRVLVVDDDSVFLSSVSRFVRDLGCQVHPCNSGDEARRLLQDTEESFDLAILDVHLRNANDLLGLALARDVADAQPVCRIVLISADDLDRDSQTVLEYSRMPVAGFIIKPLGIDELLDALAQTSRVTTLADLLFPSSPGSVSTKSALETSTYQGDLEDACESVRESIGAEAVVLFWIDPVSYQVGMEARSDPEYLISRIHRNLDRSPLRDAAIDGEVIYTGHATGAADHKKHLHLVRAYRYESCIGVPVRLHQAHPLGHALFAFHRTRDRFIPHDKTAVALAAQTIGWILRAKALAEELRHMKPFELMGKVYGSMAHDLGSALPDGTMLENLLKDIKTANIGAAMQTALSLHDRNERARGIVGTFREMARGQHDEVTDLSVTEVVAEAVRAFVKSLRLESRCSVSSYAGPPCRLRMRKSGLQQIIFNLLLNAVQQIARLGELRRTEEEILVEVQHVSEECAGDWVVVLVHDNGPGIHRRDVERVFDLHYTTKKDGCGMGLDICRSIARSVQIGDRTGSVRVRRSILLGGTTFEVRLPL